MRPTASWSAAIDTPVEMYSTVCKPDCSNIRIVELWREAYGRHYRFPLHRRRFALQGRHAKEARCREIFAVSRVLGIIMNG